MNERILCLDVGDVRIGVAVSDTGRTIATPETVIQRIGWGPDVKKILALCDRYDTRILLSGLPLNMDGSEGFQAEKVRAFCAQLEKVGCEILYQDERLTTVSAEESMLEAGLSREERKRKVDKVAAALILQQWLDGRRSSAGRQAGNETAFD
ncbi:MAG: Holliday junction resolvase RuvX [Clostridia bacterium]|nr:Holliday junction resolvase RuvX [Clostridia bacterium]